MTALFARAAEPAELLIRDAHVFDPAERIDAVLDVLVRGGRVAELGPGLEAADVEVVEAAGRHVLPAFVDPHVHFRTPGQEHKEDLATGTAAAAAGGYGAVVCMPNTDPVVDDAAVLRSLVRTAERDAVVPVGFLGAITRGLRGEELTEMVELAEAGALGFTDDGRPVVRAGILRRALQYQKLVGRTLALHEEDPSLSVDGVMHEGEVSALLGMAGIPSVSESILVARDAALARYEDGRVHFQHLSCRESIEAVAAARAAGIRVTSEVSPHHLLLSEEAVRSLDTSAKMNPPLRAEADRRALVAALRDGTIDCVATDHAPHARHEKEVPWEEAPMGTTGLESAFSALHTDLVLPGELSLARLVEALTVGGEPFGVPRPRIAAGAPASLVLVDLDATWEVGAEGYASRSQNCCFHGRTLQGRVELTLAGGARAFRREARAAVGA
jgi:dihydroorotase